MAEFACLQPLTPFFVACDEGSTLPVFAELGFILEQIWFTTEILKVMGINTLGLIVLVVKRAPLSFKKEHVEFEVLVLREYMMYKSDFYILD